MGLEEVKSDFRTPPNRFRFAPFWFWNLISLGYIGAFVAALGLNLIPFAGVSNTVLAAANVMLLRVNLKYGGRRL